MTCICGLHFIPIGQFCLVKKTERERGKERERKRERENERERNM